MDRARVEVVAEIANAHQGDPETALRLAREAVAAGADAVKFQVYFAHELLTRSHPRFDHFRGQSFSSQQWSDLLGAAKALGARVYCDVFGPEALRVAQAAGVDGFKVHSSDLSNVPLLEQVAHAQGPVHLAVGGSTAREVAHAVRILRRGGRGREDIVLLHGYQTYPTPLEDASLGRLRWLHDHFGAVATVGYMDHVDGDHPMAIALPLLAVALGARVLEKHVTLDRAAKGVDYHSSLEPAGFRSFVERVREAEAALAGDPQAFSPSERTYRGQVKKQWVYASDLPAGHVLTEEDLAMKRVPVGPPHPAALDRLVGRRLLAPVGSEMAATHADVAQRVWALVVARSRSKRLPGKALRDAGGQPALGHLLDRLGQAETPEAVVLCTTAGSEDDALAEVARDKGVPCHRGPVEDVLGRMLGAVAGRDVDVVLRVTGDDILVDPDYLDRAVGHHVRTNAEYTDLKALPSGTEVEVFDAAFLRELRDACADPEGTEYLTHYVVDQKDHVSTESAPVDPEHARDWRLTLDTAEDYRVVQAFLDAMRERGRGTTYRLDDVVDFFSQHPDLLRVNAVPANRARPPGYSTAIDWGRLT